LKVEVEYDVQSVSFEPMASSITKVQKIKDEGIRRIMVKDFPQMNKSVGGFRSICNRSISNMRRSTTHHGNEFNLVNLKIDGTLNLS